MHMGGIGAIRRKWPGQIVADIKIADGAVGEVDMVGVKDPLKVIMRLKRPPDVVVLHRGRDEEGTHGKVIQYRHVNRLRSKFDLIISAAGGVDLKEARSAIFNGANIAVANLVRPGDPWVGIPTDADVAGIARQFLETIAKREVTV